MRIHKFDRKKLITNKCANCGHDVIFVGDTCLHFTKNHGLDGDTLIMEKECYYIHDDSKGFVDLSLSTVEQVVKQRYGTNWRFSTINEMSHVVCNCKNPTPVEDDDSPLLIKELKKNLKSFPEDSRMAEFLKTPLKTTEWFNVLAILRTGESNDNKPENYLL